MFHQHVTKDEVELLQDLMFFSVWWKTMKLGRIWRHPQPCCVSDCETLQSSGVWKPNELHISRLIRWLNLRWPLPQNMQCSYSSCRKTIQKETGTDWRAGQNEQKEEKTLRPTHTGSSDLVSPLYPEPTNLNLTETKPRKTGRPDPSENQRTNREVRHKLLLQEEEERLSPDPSL